MPSWPEVFAHFGKLRVLIIGDVMIDAYIWGSVERISPEAPVPVVQVSRRDFRLGGAANVALNVLSMGATPILCALAAQDEQGKRLVQLMDEKGMSTEGIVRSSSRPTTVKSRVFAAHQHVVRIDEESDKPATPEEEKELIARIARHLPGCDVVIFEDYDKGVITPEVIRHTVDLAKSQKIPTVVDPKKRNFLEYRGVTLFKPNVKELREGLKIELDPREDKSIRKATQVLKDQMKVEGVMLTLSERGMFIDYQGSVKRLAAHKREIADVSGAGDTVVCLAALATAAGLSGEDIAFLSNLGGGLVCQHVGVVPIDREELLAEAKELST